MLNAILDGIIPVVIGTAVLYVFPCYIHRRIESGRLSEEEGESILRKIPPAVGYLFIIMGIAAMFASMWQEGYFGYSKLLALIPGTVSVCLFIFWLRHRRG
jgi:hypothetical protein